MAALFAPFVVVCALLVVAGVAKIRSPRAARAVLLDARVPAPRVAVRLLGVGEVALGAGAALRPIPLTAALVAIAYGAFCAFVSWAQPARCGCFGALAFDGDRTHVLLNAVAGLVALIATLAPPPGIASIVAQGPLIGVPLGLGMGAGVFAAYLVFTALSAAWHAYEPGSDDAGPG
jgi:hypothetical protein